MKTLASLPSPRVAPRHGQERARLPRRASYPIRVEDSLHAPHRRPRTVGRRPSSAARCGDTWRTPSRHGAGSGRPRARTRARETAHALATRPGHSTASLHSGRRECSRRRKVGRRCPKSRSVRAPSFRRSPGTAAEAPRNPSRQVPRTGPKGHPIGTSWKDRQGRHFLSIEKRPRQQWQTGRNPTSRSSSWPSHVHPPHPETRPGAPTRNGRRRIGLPCRGRERAWPD